MRERLTEFDLALWEKQIAATRASGDYVSLAYESIESLVAEVRELRALINSPRTDEFFEAVRNEAAHQVQRWGSEHDAGKRAEDWFTLMFYLLGKGAKSHFTDDTEKLKHHIVTCAAVCLNWLRNVNGENTKMRPGVDR